MQNDINIEWFDKKLSPVEKTVIKAVFRNDISAFSSEDINNDYILDYSSRNGIAGLLFKVLNEHKYLVVSSTLISELKKQYIKTFAINNNLINVSKRINELFKTNNIPVVFLKGILLAPFIYDDIALRPMSDLDILVQEEHLDKAFGILKDEGAIIADPKEKDHPDNHHLPMLIFKNAPLELHRLLFNRLSKYYIPTSDIFRNKILWKNNEFELPGPSLNDTFIYMAVHVYYTFYRGGMRLSWMTDFAGLINKNEVSVNVENKDFWNTVKKWNVDYPVKFIIILTQLLEGKQPIIPSDINLKKLKQDIDAAAGLFKGEAPAEAHMGYRIIWEQLANAKGINSKLKILKDKILRRPDQGFAKRTLHLTTATLAMLLNSIKNRIKRISGNY
jgi:hypothetical protein